MQREEKEVRENVEHGKEADAAKQPSPAPPMLEEIIIEELAVDGICGIY